MNKLRVAATIFFVTACSTASYAAALVTVNMQSSDTILLGDAAGITLSAGNLGVNGDGDIVQLGYFSNATLSNPFAGSWIALSGFGSLNTTFGTTSIGDTVALGPGAGQFAIALSFASGDAGTGNSFPLAGTPLGVRFYDGTSLVNSTHYDTFVDPALWQWKNPDTPPTTVNISFDDLGLKAESAAGPGGAAGGGPTLVGGKMTTAIAAPEPSSLMLLGMGAMGLLARRRRNS